MFPTITDLDQVPLGSRFNDTVDRFGQDEDVRLDILRYALTLGHYPMSQEETRVKYSFIRCWNDATSCIFLREQTIAILMYYEVVLGKLRSTGIILPGQENMADSLDDCRSEWLRCNEIRVAVEELVESLKKTSRWFNIQRLAGWVTEATHKDFDGFFLLKELPDCIIGGKKYGISQQCSMIDDFAYTRGKSLMSSICAAYNKLTSALGQSEALGRFLSVSLEESRQWAGYRVTGHYPKPGEEEPDTETALPGFTPSPSGIVYPDPPGIWVPESEDD